MILREVPPSDRTARTYSRSRIESTCERTTRATAAQPTSPKAKMRDALEETKNKALRLAEELQMDTAELSDLFGELQEGMAPKPAQAPAAPGRARR